MTIKYYKIDDKLFKVSHCDNYDDVCRYICGGGWIWEIWKNPSFLIPYRDLMEITEEQMNIEINKLEMMEELRK